MTTILREVAKSVINYTVSKEIVEIYGTGSSNYAFRACKDTIKFVYFEEESQLEKIDQYSFYECYHLKVVDIEKCNKLNFIGESAFETCIDLGDIKFPESLQIIGKRAFYHCHEMINVTLPASLTLLDTRAFFECGSMVNVDIKGKIKEIPAICFASSKKFVSITIPDTIEVIGYNAFLYCTKLESIELPKPVKKISSSAFSYCECLKFCTIQEGLEYIEESAFFHCENLAEIYLPSTLLSISKFAFMYCIRLTNIIIPPKMKISEFKYRVFHGTNITEFTILASVTSIDGSAFTCTESLTKFIVEAGNTYFCTIDGVLFNFDKTTLVLYPSGKGKEYIIPENTKYIGDNAFSYSNITKIVFPSTIKGIGSFSFSNLYNMKKLDFNEAASSYTIGSWSFEYCYSLVEMRISKSVSYIGYQAFYDCSSLTTVNIDEGIYSASTGAFTKCISLTHIKLPNSLKSLDRSFFSGCWNLSSIEFGPYIKIFAEYMFESTGFTTFVIPEGVTFIGDFCFKNCTKLKKVVFPASCTQLGASIFQGCPGDINVSFAEGSKFTIILQYLIVDKNVTVVYQYLQSDILNLTLPSSIKEIKESAFKGYSSLENITFTDEFPQLEKIGEDTFADCKALSLFQVCPKLYYIDYFAFARTSIKALDFCPNIVYIVTSAFYGCESLVSVPCLPNLSKIMGSAFFQCSKLESFSLCPNLEIIESSAFLDCRSLKEFTFSGKISKISGYSFKGCHCLTKITFLAANGSSLIINEKAFFECWALKEIVMDPNVNLTTIGKNAFTSTSVKKLYFPSSLEEIGENAFYNCSVEVIESGAGGKLTSIGPHCFENCTFLVQANIPDSIVNIGSFAFNNTALTSFTVPNSVKTFGDRVFENCTNLETFVIPDGSQLEDIGYKIFSDCSSLREIKTQSPNYIINEDGLFNKEKTRMIVFPPASLRQHLHMPQEIVYICPCAFFSCINLITVTFQPNSIKQIDFNAFDSCINLTKINIPASLTKVGQEAFYNCPKLTCGQIIEKPTPEIIDLLTNVGKMPLYAAMPCKYEHTINANVYKRLRINRMIFF